MPNRPPELTATARLFVDFVGATGRWTKARCLCFSVAAQLTVLLFEWITPVAVSTTFAYMIATGFAVWCLGERRGLSLGLGTAVIGSVLHHWELALLPMRPIGLGTEAWNAFARCLSITLLAMVVNGLCSALAMERWRASSDGLTGALNKMAFEGRMSGLVARAEAAGRVLVMAYMDLDGFKGVNDGHGHAAGDGVLRAFATGAADAIRADDLFARIGGDEFVVLMAVRSIDEGDRVASMLHARLTAILAATGYPVTCSMGALVAAPRTIVEAGGLELADTLMYEVKRAGKDALRVAHLEGPVVPRRAPRPFRAAPVSRDRNGRALPHIERREALPC